MISKELECRFAEFQTDADGIVGDVPPYGRPVKIGSFTEEFRAGAFGQLGDVVLNLQHQRAKPAARIGAGLELLDEPVTLRAAIEFRATQDEWQGTHWIVHAATLYGVALVDRPATRTNACARTDRTCPGGIAGADPHFRTPRRWWMAQLPRPDRARPHREATTCIRASRCRGCPAQRRWRTPPAVRPDA